jgi:hypothetical protein
LIDNEAAGGAIERETYPAMKYDPMKAYVITTGAVFGLLTLAHIWRIIAEPHLARDPWYILITVAAAALSLWAWRLLSSRRGREA